MKKLIYIFFVCVIYSCQNGKTISRIEIDAFAKKYQNTDFSKFKDVFIHVRSNDRISTIYIVGRYDGNLPVYFVTYNELKKEITEINNSILKEQKISDYFTKSQIADLINGFRELHFALLGVDNQNNVIINPFYPNHPACFIRLNKSSNLEALKRVSGDFKKYKDNWYVDQRQLGAYL